MTTKEFYKQYYGSPGIRDIIKRQFDDAAFAVGSGPFLKNLKWHFPVKISPVADLDEFMDEGLDIYRPASATDDSFYIFWDLEYYNMKQRSYIYRHQREVFEMMEPFIKEINACLSGYGINYILDTTASGYHYWMKISRGSAIFTALAEEGFISESLKEKYAKIVPSDVKRAKAVPLADGRAYDCAGKLLEYITQRIRREMPTAPDGLDMTISDAPLPGSSRHDSFSSDITQYAHPIFMRVFRVIASLHQKNILYYGGELPAADIVRRKGMSLTTVLESMWDVEKAVGLFSDYKPVLRYSDEGFLKLFNEYKNSATRKLHREFENAAAESFSIEDEPEKIKIHFSQEKANPSLLEPSILQGITEHYSALSVSRLKGVLGIIADYYNDTSYFWYDPKRFTGIDWLKYDAAQAAHFWGRVYFTQFMLDGDKAKNG